MVIADGDAQHSEIKFHSTFIYIQYPIWLPKLTLKDNISFKDKKLKMYTALAKFFMNHCTVFCHNSAIFTHIRLTFSMVVAKSPYDSLKANHNFHSTVLYTG